MVKSKKQSSKIKKAAAAGAALLAVSTAGAYWKSNMPVPAYTALRVIDGDTFETTEKQLIRLADIDAPELDRCMGPEAKKELEELIMNQPIYLKVLYRDKYMRLLSLVYTPEGFVNQKMAEKGLGVYRLSSKKTSETLIIEKSGDEAKAEKLGVYGSRCTQTQNPKQPGCNIKGNIRQGSTTKVYSLPGCESYASTIVQLHFGDQWFCTEAEAKAAGFTKAGGCN